MDPRQSIVGASFILIRKQVCSTCRLCSGTQPRVTNRAGRIDPMAPQDPGRSEAFKMIARISVRPCTPSEPYTSGRGEPRPSRT